MSVPNATRQQIDAMNKIAAEKYGVNDADTTEQTATIHPILSAHNEEVQEQDPEVEQEVEDEDGQDQEAQVEETAYTAPVKQESSKENNFKVLRERAERAEREREELIRLLSNQSQPKQQAPQIPQEDDPFAMLGIDDESLVEGKHIKGVMEELKKLRTTVRNYEQKTSKNEQQTLEMRLQTQFPDFSQVVTHDNLVQLRAMNPDLADSILKNEDQFKQAKLAYDMVKQMGIYRGQEYEVEKGLAQKNVNKPRPLTSLSPTKSESPISKVNAFANGTLTKNVKESLYQEMLQAMKGH